MTKRCRGSVSLEMALLLPAFLAVVLMTFDVARIHLQFGLLDHGLRQTLRSLATVQHETEQSESAERIKALIKKHGYGYLDQVSVKIERFDSLETMVGANTKDETGTEIFRPSDPVFRVTASLDTEFSFIPMELVEQRTQTLSSTLILSRDLLLK